MPQRTRPALALCTLLRADRGWHTEAAAIARDDSTAHDLDRYRLGINRTHRPLYCEENGEAVKHCCQKNEGTPQRCRRRARFVVLYKSQYGEQIGPNGPTPVFVVRGTYRCDDHKTLEGWRKPIETKAIA